jgi:hypothetical protein
MDLIAGLDDLEKRKFLTLLGLEFRPLGRPARRLKYAQVNDTKNTEMAGERKMK